MLELSISRSRRTRVARTLRYDELGYELLVGQTVAFSRRLEAICYLLGRADPERIADGVTPSHLRVTCPRHSRHAVKGTLLLGRRRTS